MLLNSIDIADRKSLHFHVYLPDGTATGDTWVVPPQPVLHPKDHPKDQRLARIATEGASRIEREYAAYLERYNLPRRIR